MEFIVFIFWLLDILNFSALEFLDTTIPINGLLWTLIWIFYLL